MMKITGFKSQEEFDRYYRERDKLGDAEAMSIVRTSIRLEQAVLYRQSQGRDVGKPDSIDQLSKYCTDAFDSGEALQQK